jgi:regulator of protease activity HflC (stomatin/prohibitin superfamily)
MLYSTDRQTYSSVPAQRCNCDLDKIKAAEIHTKDSSDLLIDFQVIYAIDPNQVVQVHRDWQGFYKDHFVGPVTKMITQEVASNYSAEEIDVTKQGELEKQIGERLSSEFSKKGFILDSYRIESVRLK